jgi:hypothetical protein
METLFGTGKFTPQEPERKLAVCFECSFSKYYLSDQL